jgi:phosphohistidine phosphatase
MRLLLIRHAIAEEREDFARTGKDDQLRPLTDEGRKKMKQAARGLRRQVPQIDLLATSPLTRAAQTGAILDSVYGDLEEVEVEELAPDTSPVAFLSWLRQQSHKTADTVAVVGHEPSISLILSWLLTGGERRLFSFRKGGACLVEFTGEVGAGTATLLWALTPAQLRELAD